MTPPYRWSSVYAHTPPIRSRLSSTTVLRPSATQYLHAMRPDHPAPMTITSYVLFAVSMRAAQSFYLSSNLLVWNGPRLSAGGRFFGGVGAPPPAAGGGRRGGRPRAA